MTDALVCPTCGRRYVAGSRYCSTDGTPLVDAPAADGAGPPRSSVRPTYESASSELDALLASGRSLTPPPAVRYAQPTAGPPPGPPPGTPPPRPPYPAVPMPSPEPPRRSRGVWIGLAVALALAAAGAFAYLRLGPSSLEREAYDAIESGDLVTPARANAYDYAKRLALQHPGSGAAERVGQRAFPALIEAADAFYARFYTTSEASAADWDRTARLTEWAEAIAPEDAHVRARAAYAQARIAARAGDAAAARAGYEAAAEAWPEWALPPNSLGRLLADARQASAAEEQYRRATRLDPQWPFPLSNLGALHLRSDRYADAADVLARAVRLDPARAAPHAMLARALAGQGQYTEALAEAREALDRDPAGTAGFNAASLRRDIDEWERLAQGVEDWDGDGVVEPENSMDDDVNAMDTTTDL